MLENDRVLSRVTPRFVSLWEGDTAELPTMMEMSWSSRAEELHLVEVELEVVGQHQS